MSCERRTKADHARWEWIQAQGLIPIRSAELDQARAIVAALYANPDARKLLRGGKKERTIVQPRRAGLLPLKARIDVHNEAKRQVIELKTLSTGQKFQQAEEINPAVGPVEDDGPDEVEAMAEDGFEGALESFFKGIGCRSARACPVR